MELLNLAAGIGGVILLLLGCVRIFMYMGSDEYNEKK